MDELYGHYSFEKEKRDALEAWARHLETLEAWARHLENVIADNCHDVLLLKRR
jgi:hypothetical protein